MLVNCGQYMSLNTAPNHPVAFSGNRLFKLPILQKKNKSFCDRLLRKPDEYIPVDCYFTEMNAQDVELARNLRGPMEKTLYGQRILDLFLKKHTTDKFTLWSEETIEAFVPKDSKFFMIEPAAVNKHENKLRGFAYVCNDIEDGFNLKFLQSATPNLDKNNLFRGIGTALMYGISRVAQSLNKKHIELMSRPSAMGWYDRTGMEPYKAHSFILMDCNYNDFQKRLEKKMKIERPAFLNRLEED